MLLRRHIKIFLLLLSEKRKGDREDHGIKEKQKLGEERQRQIEEETETE